MRNNQARGAEFTSTDAEFADQNWVRSLMITCLLIQEISISDIDRKRKLGFLLSMFTKALFYSIKRRKEHVTSDFERDYFIVNSTKYICYWRWSFLYRKKQIFDDSALPKKWLLQKTIKVNLIRNARQS